MAAGKGETASAGTLAESIAGQLPGLLRYARTLTRDPDLAEDLVQDTLARALERADTFRGEASPATWLHRILHSVAVDRFRRARETPVADIGSTVEARWRDGSYTVDAETIALRALDRAELRDALLHLPVDYRSAVLLHDSEGLTAAEIAGVHDVSIAAAKQRIRRGRMMLVSELGRSSERTAARRGVPLDCWQARRRISEVLDDELDGDERAAVLGHLQRCPTCPPLYAALVSTRAALAGDSQQRDPDSVVPPALAARLRAGIRPDDGAPGRRNAGRSAPPRAPAG